MSAMSFLHPGAFPVPQMQPRKNLTLPIPAVTRHASPPPASAPVLPNGTGSPSSRQRPAERNVKLVNSTQEVSLRSNALYAEIERLTAACEEHERKIRASKTSIEHRLFSELPHALSRLNEIDDTAESMTAQVHATINSVSPIMTEKLSALLSARQKDVETMRQRTTPWKTFFEESEGKDSQSSTDGIRRIKGAGLGDGDELLKIEKWAEEVKMFLTAEIAGLRRQLDSKLKRNRRIKLAMIISSLVFLAVWMGWVSLRWW